MRLKCNNIDMWIKSMKNQSTFGDKLMLFALARTFQRHVVVYGRNRCWCTIGTDEPINGDRLLEVCQVHLVYIGENMYGELRRKLFATKKPPFVSAATVYDTNEEDITSSKSMAMDLTQSAIINTNGEGDKWIPLHVHDHDYSKNGEAVDPTTEIPEFPEFANIGGSSNSSPSCSPSGGMSEHISSPISPSSEIQSPTNKPEKTVSIDSDYNSDDTINYLPCESSDNNRNIIAHTDSGSNAPLSVNTQLSLNLQDHVDVNIVTKNTSMRGINNSSLSDTMDTLGLNSDSTSENTLGLNNRACGNMTGLNQNTSISLLAMNGINIGDVSDSKGLNNAGDNTQTDTISINASSYSGDNTGSMSIDTDSTPNDDSTIKSVVSNQKDFVKNPVSSLHNLWKRDAVRRTWTVDVPKLSKTQLYELLHPPPNWDQIDPYSSLEEMTDTEEDERKSPPPDDTATGSNNHYGLRERKSQNVQSSSRTRRVTNTLVSYRESSGSDSDYNPKPKHVKPLCLAAQRNVVSHRKDQGLPSITDANNNDSSNQMNTEGNDPLSSADTPEPDPIPDAKTNKQEVKLVPDFSVISSIHPRGRPRKPAHSKPTPHLQPKVVDPPPIDQEQGAQDIKQPENSTTGKLNTKQFGLKKWKRIRKFKCSVCGFVTNSQSKANRHYKDNHPKLACPHCSRTFNNPSSRQHHIHVLSW